MRLTYDEARRIAANIGKLPQGLLQKPRARESKKLARHSKSMSAVCAYGHKHASTARLYQRQDLLMATQRARMRRQLWPTRWSSVWSARPSRAE
jgi:isopentenyldiphosphate isomerase